MIGTRNIVTNTDFHTVGAGSFAVISETIDFGVEETRMYSAIRGTAIS